MDRRLTSSSHDRRAHALSDAELLSHGGLVAICPECDSGPGTDATAAVSRSCLQVAGRPYRCPFWSRSVRAPRSPAPGAVSLLIVRPAARAQLPKCRPVRRGGSGRRISFRHNPLLRRGDGEEMPLAGHALELVSAAVLELES